MPERAFILSTAPALYLERMERKGKMKTMIATPCLNTVESEFHQSIASLRHVGEVQFASMQSSMIYKSRTDLALLSLANKYDFVLWVDSDMAFKPDLLERLMADMDGRDIVAPLFFMRNPPYEPVMYSKLRKGLTPAENEHEKLIDYPENEMFTVEGVGFGCVLMRTKVIQDVVDRYHELFGHITGYGEDLSFCIRARGCGYDIWVDPTIEVGHKGSIIVDKKWSKAYKTLKAMN